MHMVRTAFLGLFLTASTAALADTTTLVCEGRGADDFYSYDGPITVDLDEAQRTVTVHYPGVAFHIPAGHREPQTQGPLVGTFTPDEISFSIPGNDITINRVTGHAVLRTKDGRSMAENWDCRAGRKQF